jgi:hypothetical protein
MKYYIDLSSVALVDQIFALGPIDEDLFLKEKEKKIIFHKDGTVKLADMHSGTEFK